jgi:hypothetical protein
MAAPPRRCLILEADDLGLLYAFNEGVLHAYPGGMLTSTRLRANGYAYDHAIHEVLPRCPALGVGLHLCLNEAEPVAPASCVRLTFLIPILVFLEAYLSEPMRGGRLVGIARYHLIALPCFALAGGWLARHKAYAAASLILAGMFLMQCEYVRRFVAWQLVS